MPKTMIGVLALAAVVCVLSVLDRTTRAQTASSAAAPRATLLAAPSEKLDDALLEWPPPGEQTSGRIDGKHLHHYVEEPPTLRTRLG